MSNSQTPISNGIIYRDGKTYMLCGNKIIQIRIIKADHEKGVKGGETTTNCLHN